MLSGPNFPHLTYQSGGFSHPYAMESGKRGHKILLWTVQRSCQWVMFCVFFFLINLYRGIHCLSNLKISFKNIPYKFVCWNSVNRCRTNLIKACKAGDKLILYAGILSVQLHIFHDQEFIMQNEQICRAGSKQLKLYKMVKDVDVYLQTLCLLTVPVDTVLVDSYPCTVT